MEYYNYVNKPKEHREWKQISKFSKYVAEPKYDGIRMLAEKINGQITIHREDSNIKNMQFPEVITALANMPDNTIYDGELCILDKSSNELNPLRADFLKIGRRNLLKDQFKIKLLSKETPATFMAFDCLKFNGVDVMQETLEKRRTRIFGEGISKVEQYNPDELLSMIQKNDMEGIVVKDPNGKYSKEWFKFKNYIETDYKVVGINSLENPISSLKLENEKGEDVGSVNWQFRNPEQQSKECAEALIGMTVTVRHSKEKSGGKLRFPVLCKKDQILRVLAQ